MNYPPPYDPYPTYPPPPPPPPQRRSLWRWYRSRHGCMQGVLGCLTLGFIGFCTLLCVIGTPAFIQGWKNGDATSTAIARGITAAPSPTASSQPDGPHIGGTLDGFVAQYGSPIQTAPNYEVFAISNVKITAYVGASNLPNAQIVNRVAVTGPSTWRPQDTAANCAVFLPDDARRYNGSIDAGYIDYHSSLGNIVLQLQTPNCLLFVSLS